MKPPIMMVAAGFLGVLVAMGLKAWWHHDRIRQPAAPPPASPLPLPPSAAQESAAGRTATAPPARPRPSLEKLMTADRASRFSLLIRWLPEATTEDIAALAQAWFGQSNDAGTPEWQLLAMRWTELDLSAALTFGRASTDRLLRAMVGYDIDQRSETPLHPVYRAWAQRDPEAALASFALEPPKYRKHLATDFRDMVGDARARAWALAHPELHEFADWRAEKTVTPQLDLSDPAKAAAEMRPDAPYFQAANIAQEWMKTDPEAALAWAEGLTDPKQRRSALKSVMNEFLATDPGRARPLIDAMPAGLDRAQVEARYAAALAKSDPEAAMRHAVESLHGTALLEAIAGIAAEKGKTDPLAALRMLRDRGIGDLSAGGINDIRVEGPHTSVGGSSGRGAVHDVLKAAAALDPAGVMQLLADTGTLRPGNPNGSASRDDTFGYTLFSEWAARDTGAAADWLTRQHLSAGTTALAQLTADRWPAEDVAGLQALATQFSPGEARDAVVAEAARRLTATDPAGALAWAAQTGGDPAFSAAFRHVAESDPQAAVALYEETLSPSQQESQRQALTDQLARRSAADAIAFFQSLPAEAQGGVKLHDTTRAYARQDPEAASAWIAALPPTAAKDTAISGLVNYLMSDAAEPDPVAAAHWAAASLDPDGRDQRLKFVAAEWFRRAPKAAAAAIRASGLPPDIQTSLLQHAPPPR